MRPALILLVALLYVSCGGPEPRRPVEVKSGSFFKESVERNYETKNDTATYLPQTGDQILFSYNVMSLNNDTIYSAEEIGPTSYVVDKQQLFPGLQNAVKLLKISEKATFVFPSLQAYGYQGDNNAIAPQTPIKSSVELHTIIINKDSIN